MKKMLSLLFGLTAYCLLPASTSCIDQFSQDWNDINSTYDPLESHCTTHNDHDCLQFVRDNRTTDQNEAVADYEDCCGC